MHDDFLNIVSYFNNLEIAEVPIVHCPAQYFNINYSTIVALIIFFQFVLYFAESEILFTYS